MSVQFMKLTEGNQKFCLPGMPGLVMQRKGIRAFVVEAPKGDNRLHTPISVDPRIKVELV